MNRAILFVSFGTSYRKAREDSLERICKDLCSVDAQVPVYQAYTSQVIQKKLSAEGIFIPTVEGAVRQILEQGTDCLYVVASHMIPGREYQKMLRILERFRCKFHKLEVTSAVLQEAEDCKKLVPVLDQMLHFQKEYEYILMGHGTEDAANIRYLQMNWAFWEAGFPNVQIASVEAEPDLEDAIAVLQKRDMVKKVILHPFMVVAGDHANQDMAGETDSYVTRLQSLGYETEAVIRGLGEYPQFRRIFTEKLRKKCAE